MSNFSLADLEMIIASRAGETASQSYTATLLEKGKQKCAEKFGEEAVEAVIAAVSQDKPALVAEAADVLYHLLVLLKASDVTISEVMEELDKRTAQSGLQEKASRRADSNE